MEAPRVVREHHGPFPRTCPGRIYVAKRDVNTLRELFTKKAKKSPRAVFCHLSLDSHNAMELLDRAPLERGRSDDEDTLVRALTDMTNLLSEIHQRASQLVQRQEATALKIARMMQVAVVRPPACLLWGMRCVRV